MRIDIYGVFLITGETAPLEQTLRKTITDWVVAALRNTTSRASHVTVTLADAFGTRGEVCKQCELVARSAGGRRLKARGVGRTFREAVVSCVGAAARVTTREASPDSDNAFTGQPTSSNGMGSAIV